jgi:class 3 adenylate cyclase
MSDFSDELIAEVDKTVRESWTTRDGQVVPETDNLRMANDRVELDAVLLYADLAGSTEMAVRNQVIAAEIFKSYLRGVTRIIRSNGGEVRSFDGDRVMGVFIGGVKNTNAVKSGLQINWFFRNALVPNFKSFYGDKVNDYNFDQTVGIDASKIHVARGGVRANNDLIWVGRAPNVAAKLSGIRKSKKTLITKTVYDSMQPSTRTGGTPEQNMWTQLSWAAGEPYGTKELYGSSWTWVP